MDQAIADLNNVAVSHLERGDLRKAMYLFRAALHQTMGGLQTVSRPPTVIPPPQPLGMNPAHNAELSSGRPGDGDDDMQERNSRKPHEFCNTGTPFIHIQGFGIVGATGSYSPDPLINTTVISTIVIFNLAIAYHVKGVYEKAITSSRLIKAHTLYMQAHRLLHDAGVLLGSTGNAVVDLLAMAVSNNLAHVCFELSTYEESRAHFDGLIRFALTVVPSRYGDNYVGSVMDQQKSSFLLNAIILHAPSSAPAA